MEFFQGFAEGVSKPGFKSGKFAQATDATPIYLTMWMHWQKVDRLSSVPALKNFLVKSGLSESMVGDISRLRKLCTRIGYAPGKRGRPAKSIK